MTRLADPLPLAAAEAAAEAAAARLSDALAVPPPAEFSENDLSPRSPRWHDQSLSKGAAGVAVLHGLREQHGAGNGQRVHPWLARATREDLSAGPGAGLWFGAPAVRPTLSEFNLVRGLTGLGAYLLHRDRHGDLIRHVLVYLVTLAAPLPADDEPGLDAPGWWTSDIPSGQPAHRFQGGHADLGMAHGISGPLALLALATRQGFVVDGHAGAIARICTWFDTWRHQAPHVWIGRIPN